MSEFGGTKTSFACVFGARLPCNFVKQQDFWRIKPGEGKIKVLSNNVRMEGQHCAWKHQMYTHVVFSHVPWKLMVGRWNFVLGWPLLGDILIFSGYYLGGLTSYHFWQEGKTLHPYIAFGVEAGFPMKAVVLSKGEYVGSLGNTQL